MSPRRLISLSGRLVQAVVYTALAGVVLFFALTRTEVGREGLRLELQRQFGRSFHGDLQIERLTGNLLNRLSASNVQLLDTTGRVVLTVDSVVVFPRFRDLVRRTLSTGSITLVRPELHLVRLGDGSWTAGTLFDHSSEKAAEQTWSFQATEVRVVDGLITTHSVGSPPRSVLDSLIFNYADAELRDLNGRAIVDWQPDVKLLDILDVSGSISNLDLRLESLRGQVFIQNDEVALNAVQMQLGNTFLDLAGTLSSIEDLKDDPGSAVIEIELRESMIAAGELRRVFPRLGLADELTAAARIQGPLSELIVEELTAQRGQSRLSLEGTLLGLPDSLDYELAFRPAALTWRDLDAVWPGGLLPRFDHLGKINFSGFSDGIIRFRHDEELPVWQAHSQVQISTAAGRVVGDALLAVADGNAVTVDVSFRAADLDLGAVTSNPALSSRLNGLFTVAGSGASTEDARGGVSMHLSRSTFSGRAVDSLEFHASGAEGHLAGRLSFSQDEGSLVAHLEADADTSGMRYRVNGSTSRLDLGRLLLSDSLASSMNMRFSVAGSGESWDRFEGDVTLAFAPSVMSYRGRDYPIEAHESNLSVRDLATRSPRIRLSGDLVEMELSGDLAVRPFFTLARYWTNEMQAFVDLQRDKRYRNPDSVQVEVGLEDPLHELPMEDAGLQRLHAELKILRSDILSALLPMLPHLLTDAVGKIDLRMDASSFEAQAEASSDSVLYGSSEARNVAATLLLRGSAGGTPEAGLHFRASRVDADAGVLYSPDVRIDLASDVARLQASALPEGSIAPHEIQARIDVLPDRNRLSLEHLQFMIRNQVWENTAESIVDLYGDAVVVNGIRIARRLDEESSIQHVLVEGTLSRAPADTLFLELRDLSVAQISEMAGIRRPIGGTLNGRVAFTGMNRKPEITGELDVAPLSFDNRILGRLSIASRYIPGSPDIGLHARLQPLTETERGGILPGLKIQNSRLAVEGTFRLPGYGTEDGGALDLEVNIGRAEAFFFEYIFREVIADVQGYLTGSGSIRGDFSRPLFTASAELHEGEFRVPEFQLKYEADGQISADERGIHLDGLNLRDPDGGLAAIEGSVLFNDYRYFSFNLAGELNDLRVMNVSQSRELPFYGRIAASGRVTLTGPLSNTTLRSTNVVTTAESDLYIPIVESEETTDAGFIVFADSAGMLPDIRRLTRRDNLLAIRPAGERGFLDGMDMDLNISAPQGSTVHLVIDPLLGDVINAVGSGRVQLVRNEGEFETYGAFNVSAGDYLFTAGEVFFRRFLIDSGAITWDGDPLNAVLSIAASYRTRASTAGLAISDGSDRLIPLVINLNVSGRVSSPVVDLALKMDRDERNLVGRYQAEGLQSALNQPELSAQYATSVLLTNSFMLATDAASPLSDTPNQLAFNSLSQLVASQLNRYLNYALPNVDLNLGVQGESTQNLDVTYGVALRLLDERLIIRGQGIYESEQAQGTQQGMLDEFIVEVRLSPTVSVEVFYRREGDILSDQTLNTNTTGAGLSYQTQFSSWRRFMNRLFGWLVSEETGVDTDSTAVAAE